MNASQQAPTTPWLHSLEVRHFRCFERISLEEIRKVNILVGPNNIGKTALLTALRRLTRIDASFIRRVPVPDGVGNWGSTHTIRFVSSDIREGGRPSVRMALRDSDTEAKLALPDDLSGSIVHIREAQTELAHRFASRIIYVPSGRVGPSTLERQDPTMHEERRYDGSDLLVDLLEARAKRDGQNPNRFDVIRQYSSDLLGCPVQFELSVDPPRLSVALGEDPARPLQDLGEGIAQLLAVAGAAARIQEPLLLLEEPETSLHPSLQRRLIDFLVNTPGLQCVVATHSNHILDCVDEEVAVFRLHLDETGNRAASRIALDDVRPLTDLGVRPSSVAASNCVVWVEGPSDAIYVRRWLHHVASDLHVWRDFTFAFFGGALLEHASVDGETLTRLLRVNPSFFLVADSDRESTSQPLAKAYLQRVVEQLPPERFWITLGREVESYISDVLLCKACGLRADFSSGSVSNPGLRLPDRLVALGLPASARKVALAEKASACWSEAPEWVLDLQPQIEALARFIRRCRESIPACSKGGRSF